MMTVADLPAINASLNFVSTIFIATGLVSHPARALAQPHRVHDYRARFLVAFSHGAI